MPPSIFVLDFKSVEELKLQPHTAAEHHEGDWETETESGVETDYTESDTSDSEEEEMTRKRASTENGQIISLQQLMREHMPFRGAVAPIGNGTANTVDTKPRSKTLNSVKTKRRTIKSAEDDEDLEPRRRSTSRKYDNIFHNKDEFMMERTVSLSSYIYHIPRKK